VSTVWAAEYLQPSEHPVDLPLGFA
jgi:hypothetical protein